MRYMIRLVYHCKRGKVSEMTAGLKAVDQQKWALARGFCGISMPAEETLSQASATLVKTSSW